MRFKSRIIHHSQIGMAGLSGITHKDLNDFNFQVADLSDTDVTRAEDRKSVVHKRHEKLVMVDYTPFEQVGVRPSKRSREVAFGLVALNSFLPPAGRDMPSSASD
ncbi:MAG: hypothetical protein M0R47_16375 [Methylobacter sp.]|jgi:hypothetical protein|uniref:hypothetical protein n=1 Tax=Methylobacter sp. TaxID=2051955 RepID=UPI0025ED6B7A|nr:hypothetical protein [Methylobacter sp.]MCK9622097.1 hypothetical protein [Methylobacter sp.]